MDINNLQGFAAVQNILVTNTVTAEGNRSVDDKLNTLYAQIHMGIKDYYVPCYKVIGFIPGTLIRTDSNLNLDNRFLTYNKCSESIPELMRNFENLVPVADEPVEFGCPCSIHRSGMHVASDLDDGEIYSAGLIEVVIPKGTTLTSNVIRAKDVILKDKDTGERSKLYIANEDAILMTIKRRTSEIKTDLVLAVIVVAYGRGQASIHTLSNSIHSTTHGDLIATAIYCHTSFSLNDVIRMPPFSTSYMKRSGNGGHLEVPMFTSYGYKVSQFADAWNAMWDGAHANWMFRVGGVL